MHDIYIRQKRMLARKKNRDKLSEEHAVSVERVRLVVVAAAAGAAASTTVASSCELVGCRVPSVTAVTVVKTALVLGVARDQGAAASAASRIVGAAAASATGTGSRGGGQ